MITYLKHTAIAATLALASTTTMAASISFDFTNPATLGVVSVTAVGGSVTTNTSASERSGCFDADNAFACFGDGLGVGDDEVTYGRESLKIDLGMQYRISYIEFLDVFNNANEGGISEHAQFTIDGGATYDAFRSVLDGSGNTSGGWLGYTLVQPVVGQSINFFTNTNSKSDFSVARVTVSEVPLPGTLGLLGLGLAGLGSLRRVKRV